MIKVLQVLAAMLVILGVGLVVTGRTLGPEYDPLTETSVGRVIESDGASLLVELEDDAVSDGSQVLVATQAVVPIQWYHGATGISRGDRVHVAHRPGNKIEFRLRHGLTAWSTDTVQRAGIAVLLMGLILAATSAVATARKARSAS